MVQPEGFETNESSHLICKLKKSIYSLKQASRQWYQKFYQVIRSFGSKKNVVDRCIYHKISGSKFIFLVLYVYDILLVSSDIGMSHEIMTFLLKHFEMNEVFGKTFKKAFYNFLYNN